MSRILRYKQVEKKSSGKGHPLFMGLMPVFEFGDFPEGGGYPIGFLKYAYRVMRVTDPSKVLHVCSGSMKTGIRVDIRKETKPDYCCDVRNGLPFKDNSFRWIMADPPYSADLADKLYGTGDAYPSPHVLVDECLRVLKPGGMLGFMHHMVPKFHKPGRLLKIYAITQGIGYNIRAWCVFTKDGFLLE